LRQIIIISCDVGEIGARVIADALKINTTLEHFDIYYDKIGDAGAAALAGALAVNSSLRRLGAYECGIGAVGSRAMADALDTNSSLQILSLDDNYTMGDAGAAALAGALAVNSSLEELSAINCGIGEAGSRAPTPCKQVIAEQEDQGGLVANLQDYDHALTSSQLEENEEIADVEKKEEEADSDYDPNAKSGGKDARSSKKRKSSEPSQEPGNKHLNISCTRICANLWTLLV